MEFLTLLAVLISVFGALNALCELYLRQKYRVPNRIRLAVRFGLSGAEGALLATLIWSADRIVTWAGAPHP